MPNEELRKKLRNIKENRKSLKKRLKKKLKDKRIINREVKRRKNNLRSKIKLVRIKKNMKNKLSEFAKYGKKLLTLVDKKEIRIEGVNEKFDKERFNGLIRNARDFNFRVYNKKVERIAGKIQGLDREKRDIENKISWIKKEIEKAEDIRKKLKKKLEKVHKDAKN